jgi:tripartite-type tricarboxylate transporter receptor subunit TctC
MCDPVSDIVQQVEAGTMKVYATGTAVRNPALPNIPTAAALPATSRIARAQSYPSRPAHIIVGFAAGGAQTQRWTV